MPTPKISVIIPVYNTAGYLVECLDSVVNQTFRDIEIICVNDGSTDGSLDILNEFASLDNRFIVISHDCCSGSGALPRNTGLDSACGKYVMLLDSDDYIDLTMFEKLYDHAQEVNADLVICDNYRVPSSTCSANTQECDLYYDFLPLLPVFSFRDVPDTIFQINNTVIWNKLILRETLVQSNLKFQLDSPSLDDVFFASLLLVLSKRISIIREKLVYYRRNRDGSQLTNIGKHKDSIFMALSALNDYLITKSYHEIIKKSLQNLTLSLMFSWINSVGDYNTYRELNDAYKNIYFKKFNLLSIDTDDIYDDGVRRFYSRTLGLDTSPALIDILESELKPNSKIALYGAGLIGHSTYKLIKSHGKHQIVIWCDGNADKLSGSPEKPLIKHPNELLSFDFDALIIALFKSEVINDIKKSLLEMRIDTDNIYVM